MCIYIYIQRERDMDRQIDSWIDRQIDSWIDRQIDRQREIDRQIDSWIDRQIDRQTDMTQDAVDSRRISTFMEVSQIMFLRNNYYLK